MRSLIRNSTLFAVVCLFGVAGAASAAPADLLDVTVPFAFQINGQSFPAGAYTLERDLNMPDVLAIRSNKANHTGGYVLIQPASGTDPAGTTPSLTFKRGEGTPQLMSVWESGNDGFAIVHR